MALKDKASASNTGTPTEDVENRLYETAFRIWKSDPKVLDLLEKTVFTDVVNCNDTEIIGKGISGISGGITLGLDPVTAAVMLGFLTIGVQWPHALPGLLDKVNKRWKAETKAAKERKKRKEGDQ